MEVLCRICGINMDLLVSSLTDDRYGFSGKFSVWKCRRCNFCEVFPTISENKLSYLYTNYYPRKNFDLNILKLKEESFRWNWVKRLFIWWNGENNVCHYLAKSNESVLDVGCGDGVSLIELGKMGAFAFGTEQDKNVKRIADEFGLDIFIGRLDKYPKGRKFDLVCASQVIEHQSDPEKLVSEMKRLLKKDGVIAISFPNINSVYRSLFGKFWINWHVPYHQSFLSHDSLRMIAMRNGLVIKKWSTITPNLWTVYQFVNYFLASRKVGPNNIIWKNKLDVDKDSHMGFLISILKIIQKIACFVVGPINRIIDFINLGDSVIVVLEKK